MRRLALALITLALVLFAPTVAFALGLVVTNGCVARGVAPTTSGGVALQPADGTLSFKVLISPIAATGGPVLPPPGSTVILASGTAVPICVALPPGQYAYWWIPTLTPPPPLPGQLAGTPMDGDPSVAVPFVVETIFVKRLRKSYCLVVTMRVVPDWAKVIWLISGEFAR